MTTSLFILIQFNDNETVSDLEIFDGMPDRLMLEDLPGKWELRVGNINGGDSRAIACGN